MPTKAISAEDWKWKVESAADTIMRAEELKMDKKLYAAATKELKNRQKALNTVLKSKGSVLMTK